MGIIPHMFLAHTGARDHVWHVVKHSLPHVLHTNGATKPHQMNTKLSSRSVHGNGVGKIPMSHRTNLVA